MAKSIPITAELWGIMPLPNEMKKRKAIPAPKPSKKEIPVPKPSKYNPPEKNWAKRLGDRTCAILKGTIQKIKPGTKAIKEKRQLLLNRTAEKIKQSREFNKKHFKRFIDYSKELDKKMVTKIKKIYSKKEKEYILKKREKTVTKLNRIDNLLTKIGVKRTPNQEKLKKLIKDAENNQKRFLEDLEGRKHDIHAEMAKKEIKKLAFQAIKRLAQNSRGKQKRALLDMQDAKCSFLKHR